MKKYFYNITLFFTFWLGSISNCAVAQKQGKAIIDSLQNRLKNYTPACNNPCIGDTTKVVLILDLAWEYHFNTPDAVLPLCKEAISFSRKINYLTGVAQSHHVMGNFYKAKDEYDNASKYFKDEISVLDTLLFSNRKSKQLLSKKAACFNSIANLYKLKGDDKNALIYYKSALMVNEEYGNEEGKAINNANIGDLYFNGGQFPKALEYYYNALRIADKLEKGRITAGILGRIGKVYRTQKNLTKAMDFYSRAIVINKKNNDKNGMAINYQSLSLLYKEQNDINKAV